MKIMIVAATALELNCAMDLDVDQPKTLIKELHGVGQIPTTYRLLELIERGRPDILIQIGIAGSFSNDLKLGEAVVVETDYLADMGVEENGKFISVFDMKLTDPNTYPFNEKKLSNPHSDLLEKVGLKKVAGITVNQITTSKNQIDYYQTAYNPSIESMEGGAFHFCCLMKKIPFVQIRAISNRIGERDKSKWEMEKSLHALQNTLNMFLKNI
ncbi:MAG: futalosine hydrolase [Bacteroidota bacterium]|jgi:futalosine hydrolase